MRFSFHSFNVFWVLYAVSIAHAASSWGFDDATISIQSKKAGVGGAFKEKYAGEQSNGVMTIANMCSA